jgi:hypothetical protein
MALDLPITVRLLDRPSKREVDDSDGVLNHLLDAWLAAGLPLPQGFERDDLHWGVNSKIPKKQGSSPQQPFALQASVPYAKPQANPLNPQPWSD